MSVSQVSSTFPIALGAKVTGVDNMTYASTGEPYSLVVLPKTTSVQPRLLQKDDVSVAYNFANKFPGYTAQNIATKGIHEVSQRRFVLVAADRECHPSSTQQPSPLLTRASPWQTRSSRPSRCAASTPTPSTSDSRWLGVETPTSSRAHELTSALPCVWQENADKCAVTQTLSTQTPLTLPHSHFVVLFRLQMGEISCAALYSLSDGIIHDRSSLACAQDDA